MQITLPKRTMTVVGLAAAAVLTLTAGSCATHNSGPEPTSSNIVDGTGTTVVRMPDGFRNVVRTCLNGDGIYVTSRGTGTAYDSSPIPSGIDVVPADPACK